jgi:hypothetical protein
MAHVVARAKAEEAEVREARQVFFKRSLVPAQPDAYFLRLAFYSSQVCSMDLQAETTLWPVSRGEDSDASGDNWGRYRLGSQKDISTSSGK